MGPLCKKWVSRDIVWCWITPCSPLSAMRRVHSGPLAHAPMIVMSHVTPGLESAAPRTMDWNLCNHDLNKSFLLYIVYVSFLSQWTKTDWCSGHRLNCHPFAAIATKPTINTYVQIFSWTYTFVSLKWTMSSRCVWYSKYSCRVGKLKNILQNNLAIFF